MLSSLSNLLGRYRADLRAALVVTLTVTALGLPAGVVWDLVSPKVGVLAQADGIYFADPEGKAFIAGDGWFAVIGLVAGIACAIAAFARYRDTGIATVLSLAAGGVLASLLAWKIGHLLGPESLTRAVRSARPGAHFSGPLDLRARGVLLIWSTASTAVFLALVAGQDAEAHWHPGVAADGAGAGADAGADDAGVETGAGAEPGAAPGAGPAAPAAEPLGRERAVEETGSVQAHATPQQVDGRQRREGREDRGLTPEQAPLEP